MKWVVAILFVCMTSGAATNVEELKMDKRFGLGVAAGGGLSIMGLVADVNVTADFSLSAGLGTGIDYSTFMVEGKFFLPGQWVSPYAAAGVARWWTGGTKETKVGPSVLANKFLAGETDLTKGFDVWMVYPAVGVQFMHSIGMAFYVEFQYLFKIPNFANGTYAGAGLNWYF